MTLKHFTPWTDNDSSPEIWPWPLTLTRNFDRKASARLSTFYHWNTMRCFVKIDNLHKTWETVLKSPSHYPCIAFQCRKKQLLRYSCNLHYCKTTLVIVSHTIKNFCVSVKKIKNKISTFQLSFLSVNIVMFLIVSSYMKDTTTRQKTTISHLLSWEKFLISLMPSLQYVYQQLGPLVVKYAAQLDGVKLWVGCHNVAKFNHDEYIYIFFCLR